MCDLLELRPEGTIQRGLLVTMNIHPDRRHAIEIAPSVDVLKVHPQALLYDQRGVFFPITLLRKRMPEMATVIRLKPAPASLGDHARRHYKRGSSL